MFASIAKNTAQPLNNAPYAFKYLILIKRIVLLFLHKIMKKVSIEKPGYGKNI
jgi:hypothetical protein